MKKKKIWLIVAAILCAAGLCFFAVGFAAAGFDFQKLDSVDPVENEYEFTERFDRIVVDVDCADVSFARAEDGIARVVTHERFDCPHSVTLSNGTLVIRSTTQPWLGIYFGSERITVFLPDTEIYSLNVEGDTGNLTLGSNLAFESVQVETDTGDIRVASAVNGTLSLETDTGSIVIENTSTASIKAETDTGRVTIKDTSVNGGITLETDTGDITLKNTVATGDWLIEAGTGKVSFVRSDAKNIKVTTSTGDVEGTLLSGKTFYTKTGTGDKDLPPSTDNGYCSITTSTGDIEIRVVK